MQGIWYCGSAGDDGTETILDCQYVKHHSVSVSARWAREREDDGMCNANKAQAGLFNACR